MASKARAYGEAPPQTCPQECAQKGAIVKAHESTQGDLRFFPIGTVPPGSRPVVGALTWVQKVHNIDTQSARIPLCAQVSVQRTDANLGHRARSINTKGSEGRSCRSGWSLVLSSDVQQLLDLGNDAPGFVLDLDREHPLDLFLFRGIQSLLDFADLRF
jgi:hypothetical protein